MTIVFEDDWLLVIDKPSGVVVNRADTTGKAETVQDWIESINPMTNSNTKFPNANSQILKEFTSRSGIVHRLDKDTSGLLVIAKTPEAFEKLKSQFAQRTTIKKYIALVHGKVEPKEGAINAPIERSPFNRKHFGVFPGGREAETGYSVTTDYRLRTTDYGLPTTDYSLLELTPHTGRTHQIRVHMKYINHPIVSDPIYGGRKNIQSDLKWCPRLFLHAAHLEIKHPETGIFLKFDSPLPSDLQAALNGLE